GGYANREYSVWLQDTSSFLLASAGDGSAQNYNYACCAQLGSWKHFVGIIDRQNHCMKVYVDGVSRGIAYDPYSTFNNNNKDLIFGWTEEIYYQFSPFKGLMDELRIYDRVLTENEIKTLYYAHSKPAVDLTDGLVAYYSFDGNGDDQSGNNNHGVENGGIQYKQGMNGDSVSFDGVDDYIRVPSHPTLNPVDQLSISFWVKVDGFTNVWSPIVHKGGPITGGYANREYTVWLRNNSFLYLASAGDSSAQNYNYSYCAQLGYWKHFVGIIDRQNHQIKIYVDGILRDESYDPYWTFNNNNEDLIFGWTEETSSTFSPFKGQMDELRIYNRVLTEHEIRTLYYAHSKPDNIVDLNANFRLFGEVKRFGLGYGFMPLHFGVNTPVVPEIGRFGFAIGGRSYATGVLGGLNLPRSGFTVVYREFSLPFSLVIDQEASMYVGFGDNGKGYYGGGNIQVIFDFSDNISFVGSILNDARDQGLTLTSVTLRDGTLLEDAGLKFEFIPENTVLTAGASAADNGSYLQTNSVIAASAPCGRAFVKLRKATASSKLKGGGESTLNCEDGVTTDALVDLDVLPEPDPFVWDLGYAIVRGKVRIARIPSDNTPPVANAGSNLAITSEQQCEAIIEASASDLDNDPLTYRWLEGQTEILAWTPVGPNSEAYLDLCTVSLGLGQHTLTLEVSDGKATAKDDMLLTIDNSAPTVAPTGGGTYQVGAPIMVGGQVSDFDGDLLTHTWSEGMMTYCDGVVQSLEGGIPVNLPNCVLPSLGLGPHTVTLTVSDGTNDSVSRDITIDVVDTTAPTLTPKPNIGILWPPNHKMVDIIIHANASDNSGLPPTLSATIISNELEEGIGDGNTTSDWTSPMIDQATGIITLQLRAERSGLGEGRTYTIFITAIDDAGNFSTANLDIIVPHDQRNNK
ncbi:MAG: LamG domain-containing protein, partial [Desulfobulbaceae bacterium]|nr:LamG domain-containing protein [Desulfobulbaceae bacterium]